MERIFDTHAHYDDDAFDSDRFDVLDGLFSGNVCGIINCGVDIKTSHKSIELAEKYSNIYASCGIHPHEAKQVGKGDLTELISILQSHDKVIAVGEIGLDYHYDFSPQSIQIEMFERQLQLSAELNLPVIIHDRKSHEDMLYLLKKYKPRGVVHCFSGSVEMAKEVVKLGMYIGLGGAVTFKNAKTPVDVAGFVPVDRLLLETDAPYLTPEPFRGKRNTSDLIIHCAQKIAGIKNIDIDELLFKNTQNAKELFGI
jgi:TatD DNase family protein